jgi:predicted MFS family arabinose efflux permease
VPRAVEFNFETLALAGFVWRIDEAPHPFVSPALFKNRPYVAAMGVGFFSMLANLSALVFVPLLLIGVNGLSPGAAGLVLTPGAVALAILSPLTGRLSDRIGVRTPIVTGLVIMMLSMLLVSTFAGASPVLISAGILGVGTGFAFIQSPANNAAAGALTNEEVGGGMGIFAGASFLGTGTGTHRGVPAGPRRGWLRSHESPLRPRRRPLLRRQRVALVWEIKRQAGRFLRLLRTLLNAG